MARTILIVEDSKSVRTALRWVLNKSGDTVITATSVDEGQSHDTPDVAIIDYHLPDGSAVDLAKKFSDEGAATIVLAGDYHDFSPKPFASVGVTQVLRKPFQSDDVFEAIEHALSGASSSLLDMSLDDDEDEAAAETTDAETVTDEPATQIPEGAPPPPPPAGGPGPGATRDDSTTRDTDVDDSTTTEESPRRRPARQTMALKGKPRPTEQDQTPQPSTETVSAADSSAHSAVTDKSTAEPSTSVDKETLRKLVREVVDEELDTIVQKSLKEDIEAEIPKLVKDAIRELLREELNEKVVTYAKKKIDAFSSQNLPKIAERVIDRKTND